MVITIKKVYDLRAVSIAQNTIIPPEKDNDYLNNVFELACELHDDFKALQVKECEFKSLIEKLNLREHIGFQKWIENKIINEEY